VDPQDEEALDRYTENGKEYAHDKKRTLQTDKKSMAQEKEKIRTTAPKEETKTQHVKMQ
jgi:hypothetical protein